MEAFRYTPNTSRHHKKPETAALRDALSGLFAATAGPQKKALAQAQEKWRGFARAAREAADKNRRLYCSLGFLGGAALFILLC